MGMIVYLDFLSSLKSIFRQIFESVFVPVLSSAMKAIIALIGSLIQRMLGKLLFAGFTTILTLVDYLQKMYDILSGIQNVTVESQKESTILEAMFHINGINRSFMLLTMVAVGIAFLFTTFSVLRSMGDTAMENRHPVSEALRWGLQSALTLFLIPFLCLTLLNVSERIFSSLNEVTYNAAYSGADQDTVGNAKYGGHLIIIKGTTASDVLFVSMTQNAIIVPKDIPQGKEENYRQMIRDLYLSRYGDMANQYTYANTKQVEKDIDIYEINYLLSIASALCMFLLLLGSVLSLVRRIFEILVLYIVSPFFAATIALDGGMTFKRWKDMFVAKFMSAAGTLLTMRLFLLILPFIASDRIKYSDDPMMNTIITIIFVLGGVWSVYKGSSLILQLLDQEAAQAEQRERDMMRGFAMAAVSGGLSSAMGVGGAVRNKFSKNNQNRGTGSGGSMGS